MRYCKKCQAPLRQGQCFNCPPEKPSGLAITAGVCGIIGLCIPFLNVVGLVCGLIELQNIKNKTSPEEGRFMAQLGVSLGALPFVLLFLWVVGGQILYRLGVH